MPFLRALIFGDQPEGVFRAEKEPVDVATAQKVFIYLSDRLGVTFVRQDVPGLRKHDIEPHQMFVNGKPAGHIGMYFERDGTRLFPRCCEEFFIAAGDTIVVSSLA